MLPFIGVDGEGGDIAGRHEYTMLRIGSDYTIGPSNWLQFITTAPTKAILVAYFFDYDVSMMCRSLPAEAIRRLLLGDWVRVGEYRIRYHPRKFFSVRHHRREVTINDVGTFFQCPFLDALKQWNVGTPEQWAQIEAGKSSRSAFGALTPETIAYNAMECELLAELMTKFRATLAGIGYLPRYWRGPGQLAKAMLAKHGVPKTEQIPLFNLSGIWDMAQAAYFGGRFETSAVGPIPFPVEQWDINSAYPAACTQLPCLSHGKWVPTKEIHPHGLYRIDYLHLPSQRWHTLPHRTKDGSVHYPRRGSGTYWGVEILASLRMGTTIRVRHGVHWVATCGHRPLAFLADLYEERKRIGKTTAGMALKLAMNSAYGVTAQSVGKAEYANPVYAGLITATTRAQILDAVAEDPDAVYMIATDAVFAEAGALSLAPSTELGGWDRTYYPEGMHIVQPGLYFAGTAKPKTRGVPRTAVTNHRNGLIESWHGSASDSYPIPVRQFVGLRLAYARGKLDTAGTWVDTTKEVSYGWSTKRIPTTLEHVRGTYRTVPYPDIEEEFSIPYDRIIGGLVRKRREDARIEWEEQPEWAQSELHDMLKGEFSE